MRDPSEYRPDPDGHFNERVAKREIPETAITKAIHIGRETEQDNGRVKLATTYLGTTFVVVIDPDRKYMITAYRE